MRFKMRIEQDCALCSHCNNAVETLAHIFIDCPLHVPLSIELMFLLTIRLADVTQIPQNYSLLPVRQTTRQ